MAPFCAAQVFASWIVSSFFFSFLMSIRVGYVAESWSRVWPTCICTNVFSSLHAFPRETNSLKPNCIASSATAAVKTEFYRITDGLKSARILRLRVENWIRFVPPYLSLPRIRRSDRTIMGCLFVFGPMSLQCSAGAPSLCECSAPSPSNAAYLIRWSRDLGQQLPRLPYCREDVFLHGITREIS